MTTRWPRVAHFLGVAGMRGIDEVVVVADRLADGVMQHRRRLHVAHGLAAARGHPRLHQQVNEVGLHGIEHGERVRARVVDDIDLPRRVVHARALEPAARTLDEPVADALADEARKIADPRIVVNDVPGAGDEQLPQIRAGDESGRRAVLEHRREHLELRPRRGPAALGGERQQLQRRRPIGCGDDARSADHGKPVRGLGAAHLHGIAEQADALPPQARRAIADDDALRELRHRLRVAALRGVRKLVDRLVVTTVRIERSSPGYRAQLSLHSGCTRTLRHTLPFGARRGRISKPN